MKCEYLIPTPWGYCCLVCLNGKCPDDIGCTRIDECPAMKECREECRLHKYCKKISQLHP